MQPALQPAHALVNIVLYTEGLERRRRQLACAGISFESFRIYGLVTKRKMQSCELHIVALFSVIQMYEQYHYDIKECPIFINKN